MSELNGLCIISAHTFGDVVEGDCACSDDTRHVAEGDCACADVAPGAAWASLPVSDASLYHLPSLYTDKLHSEFHLAVNPMRDAGVVVLNRPAFELLNSFQTPGPLAAEADAADAAAARRLAHLGLLQPCDTAPLAERSPQTLTAWLHVTSTCNLRCTYCYVGKTNEEMDETTGRAAVDAIIRSAVGHGFRAVKLKYAGGEATLNFPLVRRLHTHAADLARARDLALREVVLSNGVALTTLMLDFVRDADMRLMISLDGLGAAHDAQRVFANGRGSARLVVRGIERALARGVRPHLSITVTGHNADGVAETVAFALDHDLPFNLNFYRDHPEQATHDALVAEDARLIAGTRAAFKVIEERLPRHNLTAALLDRASFDAPHDRPCGVGQSYLVIDQRGRVARCQMEIERTVGDVTLDDPLAVIRASDIGFRNVPVDEKEGCRDCEWRYWCAGGCPLLTYRVMGRSDVKSPYCRVYRALFPELLRLEGLRLLKWRAEAA